MDFEEFRYENKLTISSKLKRLIWSIVWMLLFRPTPNPGMNFWRISLLRLFGAKIGIGCKVAPSVKIWAPWNLRMRDYVCIADGVDCYTVDLISIGNKVTISQRSYLCTASHDIRSLKRPLVHSPLEIADHVWICSESFIGPGVCIGEGAVVAARSVVTKNVTAWTVVGGNPAKFIKNREVAD